MKRFAVMLCLFFSVQQLSAQYWRIQNLPTSSTIFSVKTVNHLVAWMCGSNGAVLRTTNGGETWAHPDTILFPLPDNYIIEALDANTAFLSRTSIFLPETYIYRTTDGGGTWYRVFTQANGFINGIAMFDHQNGLAVGDPVAGFWTIVRTTDGGSTWNRLATSPPQVGTEIGFSGSLDRLDTTVWFGTSANRMYRVTRSGIVTGITTPAPVRSVAFKNSQIGIFSNGGSLYRTTDGGATWLPTTPIGTSATTVAAWHLGFFAKSGTEIRASTDDGVTWTSPFSYSFSGSAMSFHRSDIAAGYVAGNSAAARFFTIIDGIEETSPRIPERLELNQNYPNPFNPTTVIEFQIPNAGGQSRFGNSRLEFVSLKVFDVLGREVATLVNEVLAPGAYKSTFDASPLPGGVYLYALHSAGSSATKKMICIR